MSLLRCLVSLCLLNAVHGQWMKKLLEVAKKVSPAGALLHYAIDVSCNIDNSEGKTTIDESTKKDSTTVAIGGNTFVFNGDIKADVTIIIDGKKCNVRKAKKNKDKRRRLASDYNMSALLTLEYTTEQVPNIALCFENDVCSSMLSDGDPYRYDTYGMIHIATERCEEFNCNQDPEALDLFITANTDLVGLGEVCPDVCEVREEEFIYVNDGVDRTWGEARQYCLDNYNSDLATIAYDNEIAVQCLGLDAGELWVGLYSPPHEGNDYRTRPYFYQYSDGTDCPVACNGKFSGACLGPSKWWNGEPLPCTEGSQCVHLVTGYNDHGYVHNSISCTDTLPAFLCNIEETTNLYIRNIDCENGYGSIACEADDAYTECNRHNDPVARCGDS